MAAHVKAEDELMVMSTEELLQAQLELYHHCFAFVKSMALKAATDLRVPDAIHRRGGAATLSDLTTDTGIHPTKVAHLRRIMRVLTTSGGVFSIQHSDDHGGAAVYKLTRVSSLLVESSRHKLSPMVGVLVHPFAVTSLFSVPNWFTDERAAAVSLFEMAHGCSVWEMVTKDAAYGGIFNAGMTADSLFFMDVLLREGSGVFQGVDSLVDVGGGHGAVAAAIVAALPHIRCTVLERPNVVAGASVDGSVEFIVGDMFEYIPPADALLFKWIFHDWQDEDCVKILRQCKKAIPSRDAGGKVIIIDTVVGSGSHMTVSEETQLWFDVFMMYIDGIERDELEWRKIFFEAGFSDYNITAVSGYFRSIIEVYP